MAVVFCWRFQGKKAKQNEEIEMLKRRAVEGGAGSEKEGYIEHIEEQDL